MTQLEDAEHNRVDGLLNEAKGWSHKSWLFAAVTVVLVALGSPEVELGGINIRAHIALPLLYAAVIVCCLCAFYYRRIASRHRSTEKAPRTPHPWLVLKLPEPLQVIAIAIPALVTGVTAEIYIPGPYGRLTFGALALLGTADLFGHWGRLIRNRLDERGGPATFAIFLLYFLRANRHFWFMLLLLSPLLWRWEEVAADVAGVSVTNFVLTHLLRIIGAFTYRPINRFGARVWGFAETSVHEKKMSGSARKRDVPVNVPDQRDATCSGERACDGELVETSARQSRKPELGS